MGENNDVEVKEIWKAVIDYGTKSDISLTKVTVPETKEVGETIFYSLRERHGLRTGRGINFQADNLEEIIKGFWRLLLEEEIGDPATLLAELSGMRQTRRLRRAE